LPWAPARKIALLAAPLLVFVGLLLGAEMDLVFRPFEVIALGLATIVVAILTLDGESHCSKGCNCWQSTQWWASQPFSSDRNWAWPNAPS